MRTADKERGASAVEFALVASLLFMIVFGIIQFGLAYNRIQGLQASAREGARLGSLTDTTRGAIITRIKDSVSIVNGDNLAVPCPGTLGIESGCIQVFRVTGTSGNVTCPSASCVLQTNDSDKPCSATDATRVVVNVKFRMRINIAFVSSFSPTVTGTGDFKCENGS